MNEPSSDLRCPVIAALPARDRKNLLDRGVRRTFIRREFVVLAGTMPERVYVVRRGLIKLAARDAEGRETILGLAVPGDLVGELVALDGGPQPLDAIAVTRSEVMSLCARRFEDALSGCPAAAVALARIEAERMRWMCATALERSSAAVSERIAARLLHLASLLGKSEGDAIEFAVPVAQADIAGLAGMCRESACKAIRTLRSQGVLEYRGRRLRILRPDALERLRCAGRAEGFCRSANAGGRRRWRSSADT